MLLAALWIRFSAKLGSKALHLEQGMIYYWMNILDILDLSNFSKSQSVSRALRLTEDVWHKR